MTGKLTKDEKWELVAQKMGEHNIKSALEYYDNPVRRHGKSGNYNAVNFSSCNNRRAT